MANCGKEILKTRTGTSQLQRFIEALNPDNIKLNNLTLVEWMKFAFQFAQDINYFDTTNSQNSSANWKDFFILNKDLEDYLKSIISEKDIEPKPERDVTPHLALFISFVKLLEYTQDRFNKLTKRHLDFYYKHILDIEKLPASSDKVHVIFELAKTSVDAKIAKNSELDGGKDKNGKKLIYKTTEELVANRVKISQLKSIYNDHKNNKLKAAETANSFDGLGGDFPDDDIKWWPFGYYEVQDKLTKIEPEYTELPNAKIGFALASEILEMQEGERNVQITIDFKGDIESVSPDILQKNIEIYCSGEKEWLEPFSPKNKILDDNGVEIFKSGRITTKKLQIAFQIPREKEAVKNYDSKVLGEFFDTKLPVCRLLFKTENEAGFKLFRNLIEKEILKITVDIDVRSVKNLNLESDSGTLNAKKPFYPFSTQPVKNSKFYIDYPELFKKEWTKLDVKINWKNTPEKQKDSVYDAFEELYFAYRTDYLFQANSTNFIFAMFEEIGVDNVWQVNPKPGNLIVKGDDHFKANVEIKDKEEWELANVTASDLLSADGLILFDEDGKLFKTDFSINVNETTRKNGPVRLSINQSFYHDLFPRIYALAFTSDEDEALIPNEPYTPLIETVSLNYKAQSSINLSFTEKDYKANKIKLFHEHPFGQAEEHAYLKLKTGFLYPDFEENKDTIPSVLLPRYCKGGELLIGLENAKTLQQVSLLVQVLEGSENPEVESFTGKQKVEWSVLCNNFWKNLDSTNIISNETDNFLKSGIVKFALPREATNTNTLLPEKLHWIKAKIHKDYNAVCKTIAIYAQSVIAEFENKSNELSHLENGIKEKTISKLIQRIATVKSVTQPFSSFDGQPKESDLNYYRRISERLRHKNRAITIWDYEHLILQQFPEIHKVKCLNHTKITTKGNSTEKTISFLSPGNVLIVLIPDIINKNVFDIFQPRVSTATLNAVQKYINQINSLHVSAKVINPDYEEVKVSLKVKFHKGHDENYYKNVLKEDITKLLSPWAYKKSASIEFGITLHRSIVINYLEKLDYVDYLEDVTLSKDGGESTINITPSSLTAILVSAKDHNVETNVKSCNGIQENAETCQT
ncbi:MAG: phage baseplate protein [Prolixibacteraceae bacterium]|jgi:hypothetical protein|nr:phage baseplate protein [Prolixibacteraceae bacterium]MBT6763978.1 phage baseplate protein [Prolixibacteraceae bacterium]MBT6996971.1 phage baseplate protein [Prolixibacteraceae bacterium]MBT7394249.1 phage baseplate protein [Prolixibacteraceae bacterium]